VSFPRGKTTLDLFLLAQLAVQAHLFVQISIELPATKQHPELSAEFAKPIHGQPPKAEIGNWKSETG
jgi:hypothetical protein